MDSSRPVWRVLRPVLLAAVAATSWLAISASGASADSPSETTQNLLGEVRSTVGDATLTNAGSAPSRLLADVSQPGTSPSGLLPELPPLQPITHSVTALGDRLVSAVPVVGDSALVPAVTPATDSVTATADSTLSTVVGVADSSVATVVDTVLTPVVDEVLAPILAPVVTPVVDAVIPPAVDPGLGAVDLPSPSAPRDAIAAADPTAEATGANVRSEARGEPDAGQLATPSPASATSPAPLMGSTPALESCSPGQLAEQAPLLMAMPDEPLGEDAGDLPWSPAALPGSSSGFSGAQGGNFPPVWVSDFHFNVPAFADALASGFLLQAPSPVSFDPGSSPD